MAVTPEQAKALALAAARRRRAQAGQGLGVEGTELEGRTMDPKGTPVQGFMGQVMRGIGLDPRVPTQETLAQVQNMRQNDPYIATVDTAATLGTGTLAAAPGAVAGAAGLVGGLMPGGESPVQKGRKFMENVAGPLTWDPKTQGAQAVLGGVGQGIANAEQFALDKLSFGNPILKEVLDTGFFAASLAPAAGAMRTSRRLAADAKRYVDDMSARLGVDLGSRNMPEQMQGAARERTVEYRGQNMEAIQDQLRSKYAQEQAKTKAAYDAAGETRGAMRVESIEEFSVKTQMELFKAGLTQADFPRLGNIIEDIEAIYKGNTRYEGVPDVAQGVVSGRGLGARLGYLESIRRRTSYQGSDEVLGKAFTIIRKNLDAKIKQDFDRDMILGGEEAVQAWKNARLTRQMQGELFDDHDVIMRLVQKEATSREMRDWILGANAVGGRASSGRTVNQLKKILGEDSPQFQGLREEFRFDLMEPLLRPDPDFAGFLANVKRASDRNREVVDALKPYSTDHMDELVKMAEAMTKVAGTGSGTQLNLNKIISQAFFGHDISQANMRRSLAEAVISRLRSAGSNKRKMYQELMRYDPNAPMIPKGSLAFAALVFNNEEVFSTPDPNADNNEQPE